MRRIAARALALTVAAAVATAAVAAPSTYARRFRLPDDAVRALYRLPSIPVTAAAKRRFFARDLAAALIFDSRRSDEVGLANDGDYRYDAQDMEISGLQFEDYAGGAGAEVIRAHFRNFGKHAIVTYDLCLHGPNDWRIKDVTGPSGSLRRLLSLPAADRMDAC